MATWDESKLPRWAQAELHSLRTRISDLERSLSETKAAHAVLLDREWCSVPGPTEEYPNDVRKLFILERDSALQVACLFKNDILLIGRGKR